MDAVQKVHNERDAMVFADLREFLGREPDENDFRQCKLIYHSGFPNTVKLLFDYGGRLNDIGTYTIIHFPFGDLACIKQEAVC